MGKNFKLYLHLYYKKNKYISSIISKNEMFSQKRILLILKPKPPKILDSHSGHSSKTDHSWLKGVQDENVGLDEV